MVGPTGLNEGEQKAKLITQLIAHAGPAQSHCDARR